MTAAKVPDRVAWTVELLDVRPDDVILEFGCGLLLANEADATAPTPSAPRVADTAILLAIPAAPRQPRPMEPKPLDCIVVGGGAAGLSAALVLGRARRRTLVVDAGMQSNRVASGIGGLLGHDGCPPAEFYDAGRAELAAYPSVRVRTGEVVRGRRNEGGFVLELADGARETSRRVLLATGMEYRLPAVRGIEERWGHSVFHCPFCHGWEVRDQALAVLDSGATGAVRALLLREWSDDVTLLTNGPAALEPADVERLRAAGIAIEPRPIAGLRGPSPALDGIVLADGEVLARRALLAAVTLHQRSALADQLGVASSQPGPVVMDAIAVDGMHHTNVPGVSAAGDVASQMPSIANAVAAGSSAAAMIVHGLVAEAHGLELT